MYYRVICCAGECWLSADLLSWHDIQIQRRFCLMGMAKMTRAWYIMYMAEVKIGKKILWIAIGRMGSEAPLKKTVTSDYCLCTNHII